MDFSWATDDQKGALRFLGQSVARGLMYTDAELLIERVAATQHQTNELKQWESRTAKIKEVRMWWSQQREIGIPGGIIALEEEVETLQNSEPDLFKTITPAEIASRIPHFVIDGWRCEPATIRQIDVLRSSNFPIPSNITKGEASDIIEKLFSEVSEGQRRRITFYGLPVPTTKTEATSVIDAFIAKHPEAEEEYQRWKAKEHAGRRLD